MQDSKKIPPTVLIILDGFGNRGERTANAIALARTPELDRLRAQYPQCELQASGLEVGLPPGQMGNSEVGHLNLGAGRVVYQDITRIGKAIEDGEFFSNQALKTTLQVGRQSALHLIGLISDGGVHSSLDHLQALLRAASEFGVRQTYLHLFTDGRDTPPKSATGYVRQVEQLCNKMGTGEIATVTGRFYAMDRDKRWERVARAYQVITRGVGQGVFYAPNAEAAIAHAYDRGETDEFIQPTAIGSEGVPKAAMADGDAVIFFNFRADRARELTRALTEETFKEFPRPPNRPRPGSFLCLTQYSEDLNLPVMFASQPMPQLFGEVVSRSGGKQLRIAETEKYAHVTYFFNGGDERASAGEDRVLVPSPREVDTYDQKPEMSLPEVSRVCAERIRSGEYAFVLVNFANPDMIGHTGNLDAAIRAIEDVDRAVGEVVQATLERKGRAVITADHGNCELMVDPETGEPHTAHTTNLVPLILVDPAKRHVRLQPGALSDVAPTLLKLMRLEVPKEMTGHSLIVE